MPIPRIMGEAACEAVAQVLVTLDLYYRRQMASCFAPYLIAAIRELPQDTYAEKARVVDWANRQLRELGLAIKAPDNGRPMFMMVSTGYDRFRGRIMLFGKEKASGKQRRLTFRASDRLFPLMPGPWIDPSKPRRKARRD
jgi:hypothetical protein